MSLLELEFQIDQIRSIPVTMRSRQHHITLKHLEEARRDYFSSFAEYLNYMYKEVTHHDAI